MHVQVQILSKNMKGKHVQYVVWEHDKVSPDEIYRSGRIEVKGDIITTDGFTISPDHFKKGIDFPLINDPDKEIQSYFIEVIPLDVSAESIKFGLTDEKQRMEVLKSAAIVKEKKQEKKEEKKKDGKCYCYLQGIVSTPCNGKGNVPLQINILRV